MRLGLHSLLTNEKKYLGDACPAFHLRELGALNARNSNLTKAKSRAE